MDFYSSILSKTNRHSMTTTSPPRKRRPPFSLVLPEDLESYLRARAGAGYRSITKEIAMRLERSRELEQVPMKKGQ